MVLGKVWNFFNHDSVKKVANRINRHSYSSKGVKNQMEAYDRLKESGGDGRNTTKAQKVDSSAITKVIYLGWIHFLTSLN